MENAADALKISFAILVFMIAITITFSLISQAKSTADFAFYYGDETNFYEHTTSKSTNREVEIDGVISTLYRYHKESIVVTIDLGAGGVKKFDQELNYGKTDETVENELSNYINNILLPGYSNKKFIETFTEVPIGGIYDKGEDGTEIVIAYGEKKVYITYTLK